MRMRAPRPSPTPGLGSEDCQSRHPAEVSVREGVDDVGVASVTLYRWPGWGTVLQAET